VEDGDTVGVALGESDGEDMAVLSAVAVIVGESVGLPAKLVAVQVGVSE
jgi:hypothetical protein